LIRGFRDQGTEDVFNGLAPRRRGPDQVEITDYH
jgi:hypothetical protein